jgi:uncharacterized membrane protein YeaQ/YmgE (transglycosylase-associated protein family)
VFISIRARPFPANSFAFLADTENTMNLIIQLIVGGIIGWLASIVMKTNAQMGIIANVIVGIVGSVIGAYIAAALGIAGGSIVSLLVSVVGASLLIFLLKALGLFK